MQTVTRENSSHTESSLGTAKGMSKFRPLNQTDSSFDVLSCTWENALHQRKMPLKNSQGKFCLVSTGMLKAN